MKASIASEKPNLLALLQQENQWQSDGADRRPLSSFQAANECRCHSFLLQAASECHCHSFLLQAGQRLLT